MIRSALGAAGATASAALFFFALAAPAAAHGPIRRQLKTEPPPGTDVPRTVPFGDSGVAAPSSVGTPTTGTQPLRLLVAQASAVVVADVARSEVFDEDALRVHRLHVTRVLRGRVDVPEPGVVEVRGASRRPPLLAQGEHGVFLLHPAAPSSYVTEKTGTSDWLALVAARDGIVPVDSDADLAAVEAAITAGAAITTPNDDDGRAARRRLAFQELASGSPRLGTDGFLELQALPDIGALADDERAALARVLGDVRVPAPTRTRLIQLLGERRVADALPAIQGAQADTPEVLDAIFDARSRLGSPPTRAELNPYLNSKVSGVRAAAVRELARLDDPAAFDQVGYYATNDRDPAVREAAIAALGASGRPAAAPFLARTFDSDERAVKQQSGQALLQLGGPAASNTLVDLALHGGSTDTQTYAALLLLMSRGRDDPAVQRLATSNPSPEVKSLLEHGLEFHHVHVRNN